MRKLAVFFAVILLCCTVGKVWHVAKDGFSLNRISIWKNGIVSHLDPKTQLALDQPFYYLGRGHQCYAFGSLDNRYVIKIHCQ